MGQGLVDFDPSNKLPLLCTDWSLAELPTDSFDVVDIRNADEVHEMGCLFFFELKPESIVRMGQARDCWPSVI